MSLVIACTINDRQYWYADKILISIIDGQRRVVATDYTKIRQFAHHHVLLGVSGREYDGELIVRKIIDQCFSSVDDIFQIASHIVAGVNALSAEYACTHDAEVYHTGIIIGGFFEDRPFLSIVTPDGCVHAMSHFAVIGEGSKAAGDDLSQIDWEASDFRRIDVSISNLYAGILKEYTCDSVELNRFSIDRQGISDFTR